MIQMTRAPIAGMTMNLVTAARRPKVQRTGRSLTALLTMKEGGVDLNGSECRHKLLNYEI